MIANIIWKAAKTSVGVEPVSESGPIPAIPARLRFPIRPCPASGPNASEYP